MLVNERLRFRSFESARELIRSQELKVTFIGATAVFLHTNVTRASQDLDFIIDITDRQLLEKGYIKYVKIGIAHQGVISLSIFTRTWMKTLAEYQPRL
jgi:hypothetical protein